MTDAGAAAGPVPRVQPVFFTGLEEFRAWLAEHAETAADVLVGYHKRATGRSSITWAESVDEALCVGWIDGVRRRIDDEAYCIRFTPRRPRSRWSAVNVRRVPELEADGRMHPAGLAVFHARAESERVGYGYGPAEGEQTALDPPDEAVLRADAAAWAFFSAQPPGYQRNAARWVTGAKREQTRRSRLATLVSDSAAGRRVKQLSYGRPS